MVVLAEGKSVAIVPNGQIVSFDFTVHNPPPHEFLAVATPDEEGGYSICALHYPGVISEGETIDEAEANVAEAFMTLLEARRASGEWMAFSAVPVVEFAENAVRLRIKVHG